MQDIQKIQTLGKRKSDFLTLEEKRALKAFVNSFNTVVEAAEVIGLRRSTLDRVLTVWSGAPETIDLIRKAIAA